MKGVSMPYLIISIAVMAGVTYLIRVIPFTLMRRSIRSPFLRSLLAYLPYAVLSAMAIPSIFYSTGSLPSALVGTAVALVLAFCDRSLLTVALGACLSSLAVTWIMWMVG